MSWTSRDEVAFRRYAQRAGRDDQPTEMADLATLVDLLLHHEFRVSVVTIASGSYGVALPVDGWYTSAETAEDMRDWWTELLDRIRELVDQELGR